MKFLIVILFAFKTANFFSASLSGMWFEKYETETKNSIIDKKLNSLINLYKAKQTDELKNKIFLLKSFYFSNINDTENQLKALIKVGEGGYKSIESIYANIKISHILNSRNKFKVALKYAYKALKYSKKLRILELEFKSNEILGLLYFNLKMNDEAYYFYNKNVNLNIERSRFKISSDYNNLALVYYRQKKYCKGIRTLKKSIEYLDTTNSDEKKFYYNLIANIGYGYFKDKQYLNALDYVKKEVFYCREEKGISLEELNALRLLARIYENISPEKCKEISDELHKKIILASKDQKEKIIYYIFSNKFELNYLKSKSDFTTFAYNTTYDNLRANEIENQKLLDILQNGKLSLLIEKNKILKKKKENR